MSTFVARRNPEATVKELGAETLLYLPANRTVHVLNATAQIIWSLCDGEHTLEDMEQALREEFAVPEGQDIRQDIESILERLSEKGLVSISPA